MNPVFIMFLSLGILLVGHGIQLSLLPLHATEIGLDRSQIGLTGSMYFLGFVVGCLTAARLLRKAGTIRVLMTLMSAMAGILLALEMTQNFWLWMLLRFMTGCAIAALYATIEGWIAEQAHTAQLTRMFSMYVVVTLVGLSAGQVLLGTVPREYLFAVATILMLSAIVPVGIFCPEHQMNIAPLRLSLSTLRNIPFLALLGIGLSGVITGCIWTMAPLAGEFRGLSLAEIAMMMNAIVIGGALMQVPLGSLSDRWHHRGTVVLITVVGLSACATAYHFKAAGLGAFLLVMFCFGGSALSLYGICTSAGQAGSKLTRIETSSALLLINGVGAVIGPALAGLAARFTDQGIFVISGVAFAMLAIAALSTRPKKVAEIIQLDIEVQEPPVLREAA